MTVQLTCPWSVGGTTDPATQKVVPPECAGRTWDTKAGLIEHLVTDHGGFRGWTRASAEREADEQWLARQQAEIDAAQGEDPDACGATAAMPTHPIQDDDMELVCDRSVHAGDHHCVVESDHGAFTITWATEEEEPLTLLERL